MKMLLISIFLLGLLVPSLVSELINQFVDYEDYDDSRIVGGVEADVGEYPPMIFLSVDLGNGEIDGCGASIINADYILSAAHCCVFNLTDYEAVAGVHNTSQPDQNWQRRNITSVRIHPDWDYDTHVFDLCVLKLSAPLDLNTPRLDVAQFTREIVPDGSIVTLFGWGRTSYLGQRSPVLLKANFTVVPFNDCNRVWNGTVHEESMLCVMENGKSPCHGDSGGPLLWNPPGQNGPVQVGVVSWGFECGKPDLPGMFGHVTKNLDWILDGIE